MPEGAREIVVYVPSPGAAATADIDAGSGIVGRPEPGGDDVEIYYEPPQMLALFDSTSASGVRSLADRVFHAAGYMNHRFPTVAKRVVPRDDLVAVGTFVPVKGRIIPTGRYSEQEIARWLGVEDLDPGELKLGGGAAGSQGGSDAGFTLTDWRAKYDHCPDCGGLPDDPQQTPEEGEVVGDLCTHPIHDSVAGDEGDLGVRR